MQPVEVLLLPPEGMKGKPVAFSVEVADNTNYKAVGEAVAEGINSDETQAQVSQWTGQRKRD